MRQASSLRIHHNNGLKIEVQKQNETKIKKLQTKVVDSLIFRIHCNTFFQWTSSFPRFSVKTNFEKYINFDYISSQFQLHLILVIRIYFNKNLIYPEVQAARILIK